MSRTAKTDRQMLRVGAVYRLLRNGRIASKARAAELLAEVGVKKATLEQWLAFSLKHLTLTP